MKSDVAVGDGISARLWDRIGDFVELTKPRIAFLVLFTAIAGGVVASPTNVDPVLLFHAVVGTALLASGASILNQVFERDSDARMERTKRRPIPTGRIAAWEAAAAGYGCAVVGFAYLVALVNLWAAGIALASFLLYAFVYTPLKRVTSLNTVIGAVPGALPPLVGWAAVNGSLDMDALWIFLLLFFWQFPHFFSIAWLYREDYAKGGLRMLTTSRLGLLTTGWQMVGFCLLMIPIGIAPVAMNAGGRLLFVSGILLGLQFLGFAIAFLIKQDRTQARLVLLSSVLYLPLMLCLWMFDAVRTV